MIIASILLLGIYFRYLTRKKRKILWLSIVSTSLLLAVLMLFDNLWDVVLFLLSISMLWFTDIYNDRRYLSLMSILSIAWYISLQPYTDSKATLIPIAIVLSLWGIHILKTKKCRYWLKYLKVCMSNGDVIVSKLPKKEIDIDDNLNYTERAITQYLSNISNNIDLYDLEIPSSISVPNQRSFNNFDPDNRFNYLKIVCEDGLIRSYSKETYVGTLGESRLENCLIDTRKIESQFIRWSDNKVVSRCDGDTILSGIYTGRKCVYVPNHLHSTPGVRDEDANCQFQNNLYIKYRRCYYHYTNYQAVFHTAHIAQLWKLSESVKHYIFVADLEFIPMRCKIQGIDTYVETMFLKIHVK